MTPIGSGKTLAEIKRHYWSYTKAQVIYNKCIVCQTFSSRCFLQHNFYYLNRNSLLRHLFPIKFLLLHSDFRSETIVCLNCNLIFISNNHRSHVIIRIMVILMVRVHRAGTYVLQDWYICIYIYYRFLYDDKSIAENAVF